jgi:hypothetical protein
MSLVYIAGYVFRADANCESDTYELFDKYGDFLRSIDRGGLKIPSDFACYWSMLCFALFIRLESEVCRTSLVRFLLHVANYFGLNDATATHSFTMANVLLNNKAAFETPYSSREPAQKALKLNS